MLFIKLIENVYLIQEFVFEILMLLITKNGSTKYYKLIEYFSQKLGGVGGGIPVQIKGILAVLIFAVIKFRS